MTRALIVPAAGVGSRLGWSSGPKALYPIDGRPLLDYLADLYRPFVSRLVFVIRPVDRAAFEAYVPTLGLPVDLVEQPQPTGMLDAILLARPALARHVAPDRQTPHVGDGQTVEDADGALERVWITWCDQIAISRATVDTLRVLSEGAVAAALVLPTVHRADPYIHIERTMDDRIAAIRQRREGDAMPAVGESDAGLFSLSREAYFDLLPRFSTAPAIGTAIGTATGERNFLPFIPWLAARRIVRTFPCASEVEAIGVNTPEDAAHLARHVRSHLRHHLRS